jgi:2,4-diaminopentanoate dehydrogenase
MSTDVIRAAVYGTGRIGREVIKGCLAADDIALVGAVVTDPAKIGKDVGQLAGMPLCGVVASADLEALLNRDDVDLVFYCGLGDPLEVAERLGHIAAAGKDVITVTGLIHPRLALGEDGARQLADSAVRGGARIVGGGWNPGFVLDVLPVVYASSVVRVDRIEARRVAEMREWGAGVHDECGIGLPPEQVTDTNSNPLHESVALIADGVGIALDRIESTHQPWVSSRRREHKGRVVEPGRNAGFHKRSVGIRNGKPVIEVEMIAVFDIDAADDRITEGATITVEGESTVRAEVSGDWFGDSYPVTAAKLIRMAGPLRTLPPGLYRPDQLPVSGRTAGALAETGRQAA